MRQCFDAPVRTLVLGYFLASCLAAGAAGQQTAEQRLMSSDSIAVYGRAVDSGNAARGAILFHGPLLGCAKCHSVSDTGPDLLGPNLARKRSEETGSQLIESLLRPSARVAEPYRSTRILTEDGQVLTGMIMQDHPNATQDALVLRTLDTLQDSLIPLADIAQKQISNQSVMPEGLMKGLTNESEFLDLVKYLVEIRDGGAARARELQPTSAQLAIQLPEYEANIDHAGILSDWDRGAYERGEKVYMGLCVNCHGTLTAPGSLATALRFGEGKFKHGSDPYAMYQTLTRGAGLMMPQPWMVPTQKYDVIHYIREAFLREKNPSQYFPLEDSYLAQLPMGDERGPEATEIEPWSQADYGPRLVNTYEIGQGGRNIAQKGIALQLDASPGGVAHGKAWAVFDHDTMRVAGVWTSQGFIDWQGIHFNGRHGIHPHVAGDVLLANPTGPGWAHPKSGSLEDDARVLGRDGKWYGPLPNDWAKYDGLYQVGDKTVISYKVGNASVLESFSWDEPVRIENGPQSGVVYRHLQVATSAEAPSALPLQMVVATLEDDQGTWKIENDLALSVPTQDFDNSAAESSLFRGKHYFEIEDTGDINMYDSDFTVVAKVRLNSDGTIFSRAPREGDWAPGGQSLFVRSGRLCYDVGWVGAVQSSIAIDDSQPHVVALTWKKETGLASLWVDGKRVGKSKLRPQKKLTDAAFRIGMTSGNFPKTSQLVDGEIEYVHFYPSVIENNQAESIATVAPLAAWDLAKLGEDAANASKSNNARHAARKVLQDGARPAVIMAGFASDIPGAHWVVREHQLLLELPKAPKINVGVWSSKADSEEQRSAMLANVTAATAKLASTRIDTQPTQPLYPEELITEVQLGGDQGGFAVDILTIPTANPWQARVRTSGLDFFQDGDRLAVCTWDGDVWIASGLSTLSKGTSSPKLKWRRVAFGLFQPLGLKIIDETIYLTCRDQLVRLDDRNQDGEIDYYHCVNNDHQVTEHFHEFAMGLQTDASGNFYYAKSARHALTAVVPHHGTLLRIPPDGSRTDILAKGFRAANGVCLNPDGSFIVTDQEGHWNPKNRINWVREGGFYGNMYGYHDVTDDSDSAMEPPLCWITNKFDRSPAELLWVDSPAWGPLKGQLLNLSYGYGKVYVVPHEEVNGKIQGGMCQLPIADFPTGTMRGRFSPFDGQLYLCGLAAWATNQTIEEGGIYRVRYTGKPAALPTELSATTSGVKIGFSEPLSPKTSLEPKNFAVKVWSLKRTKNYGSDHFNEHELAVQGVTLSEDHLTIRLQIPEIAPTWSMEIRMNVMTSDGRNVERIIHNTIHNLVE